MNQRVAPATSATTLPSIPPTSSNPMRFTEGMVVHSTDGVVGEVADLIIDPRRRRLTHLVVQPAHRHFEGRLIPIGAVVESDDHVTLSWSTDKVEHAQPIEETECIKMGSWLNPGPGWAVGTSRGFAWPTYGAGGVGMGMGMAMDQGAAGPSSTTTVTYDRIPAGTAEIRRASVVVSSDQHVVGHVDGLIVVDDNVISHLMLERGHLWGHREVTIPMTEVESVISDCVRIRSTRDEIGTFPAVAFHRHDRPDS